MKVAACRRCSRGGKATGHYFHQADDFYRHAGSGLARCDGQ